MSRKTQMLRRATGAALSVGLALSAGGETMAAPRADAIRADIGYAAISGTFSMNTGLPESFGGALSSVVSFNARDAGGKIVLHASGVKIGPNKVLAAGHPIYHLRGDFGEDPGPGYCDTLPGLTVGVGFSSRSGRGSEVHVTGVALSDGRDLAVLTIESTPQFASLPSAKVANLNGDELPAAGKGIIIAGYPGHKPGDSEPQDPSFSGKDAQAYVWTGPLNPADNYEASIYLPPGTIGGGTSGGPVISGETVVGVIHGGTNAYLGASLVLFEHTVGVSALASQMPEPVCA